MRGNLLAPGFLLLLLLLLPAYAVRTGACCGGSSHLADGWGFRILAPGSLLLLLPADAVRTGDGELERNWKGLGKELERKRLDKD